MSKHLRWESHKGHWELLKEFYALNKYLITEQLKKDLNFLKERFENL